MKNIYTAEVTSQGGREGKITSADGKLSMQLSKPPEMGGAAKGAGLNPEVLFAGAYAACFHGALQNAAERAHVELKGATVTAFVRLKEDDQGGYHLTAELRASLPGIDRPKAEKILQQAHQTCPYSRAMRERVDVQVTLD